MIFVDEARIYIKAGDGGKGCESFYSDKLTRYPRPDGGDGGKGAEVIFVASRSIQTLLDFRFKQHYKAERGGHGSSKGKKGRNGSDCVLKVPVGTLVKDYHTGLLIKDLVADGQSVVVAKGGRGGHGNAHNRTPTPPSPGEDFDFIVADLPGLIEGAHEGKGLGDRFLRHTEGTKLLVHVIDMGGSEGRDPWDDYEKITHELQAYNYELFLKPRVLVANKMDLPDAPQNLKRFKRKYTEKIFPISALNKSGLEELIKCLREKLC